MAAVRFPASELAGGEGEVGEELEDIDGYPKVVLDGVGGDWTELATVAVGTAIGVDGGGGAPVREGRSGPAGKVHWTTRKLSWGSIWVEEGRSRGFCGERAAGGGSVREGGAASAVRGGGEQVWELHGTMRKVSMGSIGTEEYRR